MGGYHEKYSNQWNEKSTVGTASFPGPITQPIALIIGGNKLYSTHLKYKCMRWNENRVVHVHVWNGTVQCMRSETHVNSTSSRTLQVS